MNPGHELDVLVAERVLGCKPQRGLGAPNTFWCGCKPSNPAHEDMDDRSSGEIPCYSTRIAAAWTVVEKLQAEGFHFHVYCPPPPGTPEPAPDLGKAYYFAQFERYEGALAARASADSAPLAICKAALHLAIRGALKATCGS